MEAKEIRDMIKTAERRAKNVYMDARPPGAPDAFNVRVINAREHKGFTQVLTISGRWRDLEGNKVFEQ